MRLLGIFLFAGALAIFATSSTAAPPWVLFGGATPSHTPGAGEHTWSVKLVSNTTDTIFSGVAFQNPGGPMVFNSLWYLSADFNVTANNSDCGGGSPRFQLALDSNGDGDSDGNIFVYAGPVPNFTGCDATEGWQTTGNLIPGAGEPDPARWDLTQFGGPFYGTYALASAMAGSWTVLGINFVVDAGWFFPISFVQTVLADRLIVNDMVLNARGFAR